MSNNVVYTGTFTSRKDGVGKQLVFGMPPVVAAILGGKGACVSGEMVAGNPELWILRRDATGLEPRLWHYKGNVVRWSKRHPISPRIVTPARPYVAKYIIVGNEVHVAVEGVQLEEDRQPQLKLVSSQTTIQAAGWVIFNGQTLTITLPASVGDALKKDYPNALRVSKVGDGAMWMVVGRTAGFTRGGANRLPNGTYQIVRSREDAYDGLEPFDRREAICSYDLVSKRLTINAEPDRTTGPTPEQRVVELTDALVKVVQIIHGVGIVLPAKREGESGI